MLTSVASVRLVAIGVAAPKNVIIIEFLDISFEFFCGQFIEIKSVLGVRLSSKRIRRLLDYTVFTAVLLLLKQIYSEFIEILYLLY